MKSDQEMAKPYTDEASQWKRPKFDPVPSQSHLTDLHENWHAFFYSLHPERIL